MTEEEKTNTREDTTRVNKDKKMKVAKTAEAPIKKEKIIGTKHENQNSRQKNLKINSRGRTFEGIVKKKFPKRIVIEFERMIYISKYERYAKLRTKVHARLPEEMEREVQLGDLVRVQECRPLSKLIHFIAIKKIKDASEVNK